MGRQKEKMKPVGRSSRAAVVCLAGGGWPVMEDGCDGKWVESMMG